MVNSLPALIVECLGLPSYAPKVLKRAAASLIVGVALLQPDSLATAVQLRSERYAEHLEKVLVSVVLDTRDTRDTTTQDEATFHQPEKRRHPRHGTVERARPDKR
ncbi:hypothetical protein QWY28_21860 [Nocardioides sp. SOB77]|uniref:Uncharacterized protein n=1 Tax=Nocardioides oceani TaxID=3058369 RepID=A0ABT8FLR9_9ACTN|nr:hypothetical protein [Nocardioides oceani]MDN4175623.1 hypothetical protein [Nocardioides oceani]